MVTFPAESRRDPVRVMHIIYALQPGGMEFGVVKLVNELDPTRVRSSICSTRPAGILKNMVPPHVPIFEFNRRDGNDFRLVWQLYKLFQRERPDVVHTHSWGTLIEGIIAARMARVSVIVHGEHGTLQHKAYQRIVQRMAWSGVDRVLSVSSRLAQRMASEFRLDPERITTIRNGVDLDRFGPRHRGAGRGSLGLREDAVVIGTVGRMVPVKDHATLLESIALVRQAGFPVILVIAGDGPLRRALVERATALGIDDALRLPGHCTDVEAVLAAMDVFVLSSVSEGLSNTILEAMATGLPVVATRVGGADELVVEGVTGLLVRPSHPREMAAALQRLFRDQERMHAMGAAARSRVQAEFNLRAMVARYEGLYLELCGAPGATPSSFSQFAQPHSIGRESR
jgi:sugar transferase (PEP-CTERM/EpsH1 system associated)